MWLFRRKTHHTTLTIDPASYDPDAARLHQWMINRGWHSTRDFLPTVVHPDDRAFYVDTCASAGNVQQWIGDWAAEPDSTLPVFDTLGDCVTHWLWQSITRTVSPAFEQLRTTAYPNRG